MAYRLMPHRLAKFGLPAILIAYLVLVSTQASTSWFGYYHDDSLYWSAARSLADGNGYRMASVPGEPLQTKYPVAFPWLLSLVWRLEPEFPANLDGALWLVRLSGVAFLGGAFALLRQLGFGSLPSIVMTAVCALHPIFLHLSGLVLSDVPFMAVAVWSLVSAQHAFKSQAGSRKKVWWAVALGLAALATFLRTIGIALPAGMALTALWRKEWAPSAVSFGLCLAMVAAAVFLTGQKSATSVAIDGYGQTIQFYRSYIAFWKLSTPDWSTFVALLTFNLRELVKEPAVMSFMLPASGFAGFGWQLASVALSFTVVKGLLRVAENQP